MYILEIDNNKYPITKYRNNIKKMITDLGKNDRPMQPETFNLCMDQGGLNFEMVKEGDKNFIIRRKVDKKE